MKELIPAAFILFGVSLMIFFGISAVGELMNSADTSINSTSALNSSFEMATNSTVASFSILSNLPLLLVAIILFVVLFAFVGIGVKR